MKLGTKYWLELYTLPNDGSCHRAKLYKDSQVVKTWSIDRFADREEAKRVALRLAKDYLEDMISGVQFAINEANRILRAGYTK